MYQKVTKFLPLVNASMLHIKYLKHLNSGTMMLLKQLCQETRHKMIILQMAKKKIIFFIDFIDLMHIKAKPEIYSLKWNWFTARAV